MREEFVVGRPLMHNREGHGAKLHGTWLFIDLGVKQGPPTTEDTE